MHIYKPLHNICAKFLENWWKTVGTSSRRIDFSPSFARICYYHGNILCLSIGVKCVFQNGTLQGKLFCHISSELVKNWVSSSRRKIGDRPPDRPTRLATDRPTDDTLSPIYPPVYTTCMRGYNYKVQTVVVSCWKWNKKPFMITLF